MKNIICPRGEQCTEDNIKTEEGNFCCYDCWREFTNK